MPLPPLIEIVPLAKPVRAEITVPGSKSITNRALILAALAEGETTLRGALWSEDTQVMVECLQELGFMVNVAPDRAETCNRTITVYGLGGTVPRGGTAEQPLELFVGNAGTAARFLAAFVCLGTGAYRLHGIARMHERPQAALFAALRELGYRVDSANDKLPAVIFGGGERSQESGVRSQEKAGRRCRVSVEESSQFASALLLCARHGAWEVEITGANEDEMPYVTMTRELVKVFPRRGGEFQVEPDASGGSYFWAADWLCGIPRIQLDEVESSFFVPTACRAERLCAIRIRHWPESRWQIDARFPLYLPLPRQISRATDLGDSIMTAICLAADENTTRQWRWDGPERKQLESEPEDTPPVRFTELGRLRVQECERVVALRTELTKCGARVVEEGDTLTVFPSELHGAEIETYNDHRMAMCFAVLGLKVPGIKIKNPACVKKTFPNFFQKLAARPPHGLGAEIRDALTGRRLTHDELFAD